MTTPEAVFARVAEQPGAAWLDGGADSWSVLAWAPDEVQVGGDWMAFGRRSSARADGDAPFAGGCLGWVGYEATAAAAPPGTVPEPSTWLARYPGGVCHHPRHGWRIAGPPAFARDANRWIADAVPLAPPPPAPVRPTRSRARAAYRDAFRAIQDWLAAGDCYQVNLTRAVETDGMGAPFDAYRRLRSASDAAYGAFLRPTSELAILSNSPELLLEVDGHAAGSEPIKGTRRRDPGADALLLAELEASPKERAELAMIVDLVRNDLGRVAVVGSVHTAPRILRSHATVHHASQRVSATLRPELDAWDALAALSPAGSVTGAPKRRATERIAAVEPTPRGVYCGSIGFVSGTRAVWSVAIRTAVQRGDTARWHVGGGIVAGADPDAEWAETVAKGRALARALAGTDDA